MYKIVICAVLGIFAVSQGLIGKQCTNVAQCDAGECCQILSAFMVMSKRQEALSLFQSINGTCQKYRLEGDNCSSFEKMNGYCGCEPSTVCHMYEVPVPTAMQSRMMVAPRPGYQWVSKCEKPTDYMKQPPAP